MLRLAEPGFRGVNRSEFRIKHLQVKLNVVVDSGARLHQFLSDHKGIDRLMGEAQAYRRPLRPQL